MVDNWLRASVRVRARRRLVLAGIVLATIGASYYAGRHTVRNAWQGPVDATPAQLEAGLHDPEGHDRYRVHGSHVIDTGAQQITSRKIYGVTASRYKSAEYYVVQIGDRALLVRGSAPTTTPSGELKPIPDDVAATVFAGVSAQDRAHFYPYLLDAVSDYAMPVFGGAFFALLFGIPALISGTRALLRLRSIDEDATVQRLENRPGAKDYVREAEEERQDPIYSKGNDTLTQSFVISKSYFHVRVFFLEDLLWAYVETQRRRVNGVPAGKSTYTWLKFEANTVMLPTDGGTSQQVFNALQQRVPWAVFGWTDEIDTYFTRNKPAFLEWVSNRHRAVQRGDSPETI